MNKLEDDKTKYDKIENRNVKIANILFVVIIIAGIYYYTNNFNIFNNSKENSQITQNDIHYEETYFNQIKNTDTEELNLEINPLENYSGYSKDTIYELRKKYVEKSIFARSNYEPDESVFGQIEDGKLWWGYPGAVCSSNAYGKTRKTGGDSTMSRFINNPEMLVTTYFGFNLSTYKDFEEFCDSETSKTIPYELSYNPKLNLFTAKYKMIRWGIDHKLNFFNFEGIPYPMELSGMNAIDMGFNFVYIDKLVNINMLSEDNASKSVYHFTDFIHVGSSCGEPSGCNNLSPRQTQLEYYLTDLPAGIVMKLWKEKPESPSDDADVNYRILFVEE